MPFSPTKRKRHQRRKPKEMVLNITSMIDVFTILLVFLLKSYSSEGHLVNIAKEIRLPVSTAEQVIHPAVNVAFNGASVFLEGGLLIDDVAPYLAAEEMLIEPLYEALRGLAARSKEIAEVNPAVVFTGEIVLQGDREIPFRLLKKVIYTAGQAEYVNQSLAVFQE
ncbi:MAG: biopolymer transporter ExbD [Deferrisomatales bacterium]|nr:biopolymer transporter ExbD [Deferrisomatales bacterium]